MATMRSEAGGRVSRGVAGAALALALLYGDPAVAETKLGPVTLSGEAELGGRIVWDSGDEAKFEEYRDLRDGVIGNFDLLLENEAITHWLRGRGENLGYDDQRYWLEGGRYGRYQIEAFYGELPHIFSDSARTPYGRTGKNTFVLPPAFPNIATTIPDPSLFRDVDQELKWREGSVGTSYHLGESLLFKGRRQLQEKLGSLRVAGALVLPDSLRDALAQALPGFGGGAAAASAKVVVFPACRDKRSQPPLDWREQSYRRAAPIKPHR